MLFGWSGGHSSASSVCTVATMKVPEISRPIARPEQVSVKAASLDCLPFAKLAFGLASTFGDIGFATSCLSIQMRSPYTLGYPMLIHGRRRPYHPQRLESTRPSRILLAALRRVPESESFVSVRCPNAGDTNTCRVRAARRWTLRVTQGPTLRASAEERRGGIATAS